jgi:CheY-like chemotaxis protein
MLHVLLVEGNGADVLLVREAIRNSQVMADVMIAYDGEQALRLLNEFNFKPDFIILDLNVPKFNGLQILESYRTNEGAPVVVFTSSINPQERKRALELGAREYLTKPSDLDEYMQTVQSALERWLPDASSVADGDWASQTLPRLVRRPSSLFPSGGAYGERGEALRLAFVWRKSPNELATKKRLRDVLGAWRFFASARGFARATLLTCAPDNLRTKYARMRWKTT